jgi:hypothetical protein
MSPKSFDGALSGIGAGKLQRCSDARALEKGQKQALCQYINAWLAISMRFCFYAQGV